MKMLDICARNLSAAIRETLNAKLAAGQGQLDDLTCDLIARAVELIERAQAKVGELQREESLKQIEDLRVRLKAPPPAPESPPAPEEGHECQSPTCGEPPPHRGMKKPIPVPKNVLRTE